MKNDALEIAREDFQKRIDEGFNLLHNYPEKAADLTARLLQKAIAEGWRLEEALATQLTGIIKRTNGHLNEALEYYRKALKLIRMESDENRQAVLLNNIGNIYLDFGRYSDALKQFKESVRLSEKLGNQENTAVAMNNIGIIYYRMGEYDQSLKHHQEALRISREINDHSMFASSRNYISVLLARQGYLEEAIQAGLDSLRLYTELENRKGIASVNGNLGTYYIQLGDSRKALAHLEESYRIALEMDDRKSIISTESNIGKIYKDLGDNEKAYEYLEKALMGAREFGIVYIQQKILFLMHNMLKADGNYERALDCHEEYHELKVSSLQIERSQQLAQIHTQYEFEKKEREAEIYRLRNIELAETNRVLQETRDELVAAERQNSTLAMAVTANHEINQPLMIIRGSLDMLEHHLSEQLSDPKLRKYVTSIHDSIKRIQGILAKFKKVGRLRLEPYSDGSQMIVFEDE